MSDKAKIKVEYSSYDGYDDSWTAFYEEPPFPEDTDNSGQDVFTFMTVREPEPEEGAMPVVSIENGGDEGPETSCRIDLMLSAMTAAGWLVLDPQGVTSLRSAYDYLNDRGDAAADQLAEELHELLEVLKRVEVTDT